MNNEFGISDQRCGSVKREAFLFVCAPDGVNDASRDTGSSVGFASDGRSTHLPDAELIRCLRAQVDHCKKRIAELEDELEEERDTADGLREDNTNLRAMVRGAYEKLGYYKSPQ